MRRADEVDARKQNGRIFVDIPPFCWRSRCLIATSRYPSLFMKQSTRLGWRKNRLYSHQIRCL